jgi:transcription elongation factor Elf1
MQHTIVCSNCGHIIPCTVPELTADVWHSNCPACGCVTELKATLGKAEESPSFEATDENLLGLPPLLEPKT